MEEYTQITLDEWQQWKEDIRRKLQETASNFVYIGYRLKQIRDSGMFDGCESIFEFAKKEYGLERSTVSRFMSINDKFSKHGNSIELRDEFVGLNQSQLSEMLSLPVSDYDLVTEDTSIKDIRELKKFEKDAMNPPEEESEPVQEHEEREYTPLQKCIIDFFRDKLDLLEEVEKAYTIKDAAELIAPSGCTTHRKGIVFLTMMEYDKGVKYKQMGVPLPISMTWDKFFDQIREVFFDFAEDYKDRLKELYPESVQKEPESVQKPEKNDKEPQKTEEIVEEPQKTEPAKEKADEEKAEEEKSEDKNENSGSGNQVFEEIINRYSSFFKTLDNIKYDLENRKWDSAHDGADRLERSLMEFLRNDPEDINKALDSTFEE